MGFKNIFILGLFCSSQVTPDFNEFLLKQEKLDPLKIKEIRHRQGKWPGKTVFIKRNNKKIMIKFHRHYPSAAFNSLIFTPGHCLLCADIFSEEADISLGDPWGIDKPYKNWGKDLIVVRTSKGKKIIEKMILKGKLAAEKVSPKQVCLSQISSIERKKIGIYARVKLLKLFKFKLPASIKIVPPLDSLRLTFYYPLELINIFNAFFIPKNKRLYQLIFALPKNTLLFYKLPLLTWQKFYRKVFLLKLKKHEDINH